LLHWDKKAKKQRDNQSYTDAEAHCFDGVPEKNGIALNKGKTRPNERRHQRGHNHGTYYHCG
jgi:hypothetical protein